jgi:hypothetical protein
MVRKRYRCVDRGGGSPMTRTLAADAVMSACDRAASGRPAPPFTRRVSPESYPSHGSYAACESYPSRGSRAARGSYGACGSHAACWSHAARGSACVRRAFYSPAVRSGRLRPARPPLISPRAGVPRPCRPVSVHRLYLYLIQWPNATLFGCSFDPGRDVLCNLISTLR